MGIGYSGNCHYCGAAVSGAQLHRDHFLPKKLGGNSLPENLVPSCGPCNSIKGSRTVDEARTSLLLRKIGWPRFTADQISWLRSRGFDLSELDNARLAFEADPAVIKRDN